MRGISVRACLVAAMLALMPGAARAYDLHLLGSNEPPVEFHGFASQGYIASSDYNYLGQSSQGSFKFTEAGLNAAINPFDRTRIAVQGFTYDVGQAGQYDFVLDYALAEYTFNDAIGIRAGRIRRPEGLYNDIQDVDVARTWVLLPQGINDARWRDFYVSIDGADAFGTLQIGKAGSFSYDLYYGLQRPKLDGGLALQKANLPPYSPLVYLNSPRLGGGQLWWHTPLEGLRAGAALNYDQDLTFRTANGQQSEGSPLTQVYSLEYLWHSWAFEAQYRNSRVLYDVSGGGMPASTRLINPDGWSVSASYRFNHWLQAGTYYTEYYADIHNRNGIGLAFPSDGNQKDAAVALRFDLTDWWVFKVEGHHINGTALLLDNPDNPTRGNNGWYMLDVKTTISF